MARESIRAAALALPEDERAQPAHLHLGLTMPSATSVKARPLLEELMGQPLSLGGFLEAIRIGEEQSLAAFAARLGIARGNLCDIAKGRRRVSLDRAAAWAKLLGYADWQFVALALQDEVRAAGLKIKVSVRAA